jgi:predicted HTH transcriptional regulator
MIRKCREAGLPEPHFRQVGDQWVVTLWRDWLTPDFIAEHGLNERQSKALELVRKSGRLTNLEYRVSSRTPTEVSWPRRRMWWKVAASLPMAACPWLGI